MSIMAYNGGAVVAMKGENCVAIAADKRFGIQLQTIGMDWERIFPAGEKLFVGIPGLATDTQTVSQRLKFRTNLYELRENRNVTPQVLSTMVSNFLYEHRFGYYFVEPIIAGLDAKNEPFISGFDLIGCEVLPEDFVVAGTCDNQLYGMCESLWKPKMNPDELFETISQALVNACDRDAISGWGAKVYIIEPTKVTIRNIRTRMD
uniref:Proteasome subunit beta n=1 Tax=Isotomurus palustris TaxID=36144 RepID=A0A481SXE9_9HEXA|nr:proteasome subunit beta type protein [Isotomurus palustris]